MPGRAAPGGWRRGGPGHFVGGDPVHDATFVRSSRPSRRSLVRALVPLMVAVVAIALLISLGRGGANNGAALPQSSTTSTLVDPASTLLSGSIQVWYDDGVADLLQQIDVAASDLSGYAWAGDLASTCSTATTIAELDEIYGPPAPDQLRGVYLVVRTDADTLAQISSRLCADVRSGNDRATQADLRREDQAQARYHSDDVNLEKLIDKLTA